MIAVPVPRDADDRPTLLLRRSAGTGKWAWKRTSGPWIGGFRNAAAARRNAEDSGLPIPYEVEYVEGDAR